MNDFVSALSRFPDVYVGWLWDMIHLGLMWILDLALSLLVFDQTGVFSLFLGFDALPMQKPLQVPRLLFFWITKL